MGKVLHASQSGYFPYCIIPYQESEFFPFVSTSSLDDAMRLFWRIRKIRFYGTYEPTFPFEGTRNWQMVVESAAGSEEELVCNPLPGWIIKDQENLVNDGGFFSAFSFEEVTSFGEGYVVRLSFGGFFQDTFGPEGWGFNNPSQTESEGSIDFEGVEMWGANYASSTFNYEIEYWSYGGTYDTTTGQPL
jgi:hypothetical protein